MRNGMTKQSKGFTLIETMIAVSILVLAILGPLTIASNALHSAYYASDQVTAFYLAQEGIEYARSVRDNNLFYNQTHPGGRVWDQGLEVCDQNRDGYVFCGLDSNNAFSAGTKVLFNCDFVSPNCRILQDSTGAFHQNGSGSGAGLTPTNFYRTITVRQMPGNNGNEDKITVQVTWKTGNLSSPVNFQITEDIFNWQP